MLDFLFLCLTGSRGREKGEFTNLQGISASGSGRVIVADSNNQCIQVGDLATYCNIVSIIGFHLSPFSKQMNECMLVDVILIQKYEI